MAAVTTNSGFGSRKTAPALLAAVAGMLFAGCLDGSHKSRGSTSFMGGWSWVQGGCRQMLAFDPYGGFSFGVELALPGGPLRVALQGTYAEEGGSGGEHILRLYSGVTAKPSDPVYCAQWARRTEWFLPLDAASAVVGADVRTLSYREAVSAPLGPVLIGTANDRTDRFALFRRGGSLTAARLDGSAQYSLPLYAARPGDATRDPVLPTSHRIVNLPEAFYTQSFAVEGPPRSLQQIVLNVTQAADVTFLVESSDATSPRCHFVAYPDLFGSNPIDPAPIDPDAAVQTLRLNPADSAAPLIEFDVDSPDGPLTAYLMRLEVKGVAIGECTVTVRALSTAAMVLDQIQADPAFAPLFERPFPGPDAFAVGSTIGHGEAPRRVRWNVGVLARGMAALPERIGTVPPLALDASGGAPFFDMLNLLGSDPGPRVISVGQAGGAPYLNLFGASGTGLGPFRPIGVLIAPSELGFPAAVSTSFAEPGASRWYRFSLPAPGRVAIWSEGGLDTFATLQEVQGWYRGGDDDGAADGNGFLIVRRLAAGSYDLRMTARNGPGAATLHVEPAGAAPVADEALEACLIANGLERAAPGALTGLSCVSEGITSLQGIAATGNYRRLELAGNLIASAAPLASLAELRVLSLSDNALRRVDELASLAKLTTLSLAHNPLDSGAIAALAPLARTLRLLDLTGSLDVPEAQATALKADMPHTIIITPQGAVLP